MATKDFAQFRSSLLEPAAATQLLSKSKFKSNTTERQVKFKHKGTTGRQSNWEVINPGPKRAYKMFEQAFKNIDALAADAMQQFLSKLQADDFTNSKKRDIAMSRAMRFIGETVKRAVLKKTPRGKARKGTLITRPDSARVDQGIEIVPAGSFREVPSTGFVGIVIVGKSVHTFNVEEGEGRNEVLGTIKIALSKREKLSKQRRKALLRRKKKK